MSFVSRLRNAGKKMTSTLAVVATAATVMVGSAGVAQAGPRDFLRADATGKCQWDAAKNWVQRCDVYSPAMGRNIAVQIQPAARGGNAGLYLLDGMKALESANAWTLYANAQQKFLRNNLTLVMPVGGAGSFYADWDISPTGSFDIPFKWETFLTQELPGYLQRNFGVSPTNNSVVGLSSGGTAALNLASRHPAQFKQTMSYSGYLTMNGPGSSVVLTTALVTAGGLNPVTLGATIFNPKRAQNDPMLNAGGLRNTDVYISAGSGIPGPAEAHFNPQDKLLGSAYEIMCKLSTQQWELAARAQGVNPTADYPATGLHNWVQWEYQLNRTHDRIVNVLNAR